MEKFSQFRDRGVCYCNIEWIRFPFVTNTLPRIGDCAVSPHSGATAGLAISLERLFIFPTTPHLCVCMCWLLCRLAMAADWTVGEKGVVVGHPQCPECVVD